MTEQLDKIEEIVCIEGGWREQVEKYVFGICCKNVPRRRVKMGKWFDEKCEIGLENRRHTSELMDEE